MRQIRAIHSILCAAMLATPVLATAQTVSSGYDPSLPKYLNLPPKELIHPEQFGIEDFGRTSALAVREAMAIDEPADSPSTPTSGPLPTQIANGAFNNGSAVSWMGFARGDNFFLPDHNGPVIAAVLGLPAPSGAPAMHGDAFNVTGTPHCAQYGRIWQDVRVLPGTILRLNWQQATSAGSTTTGEGTLTVSFRDPSTGDALWTVTRPSSQFVSGGRYSEFDLKEFAGLDVRIRFESKPYPQYYPTPTCNNTTWVDNVALEQRPIAYRNVLPTAGQWYNPLRAGSGWDLRRAPNGQYFAAWYTFQNGTPIWYLLDLATVSNGKFETTIRRFQRVGTTSQESVVGRARLQMLAVDKALMSFDFYDTPNNATGWDNTEWFQLLMPGGGHPYNGQWFDNQPTDPNWGIATLVIPNNQVFTTQYFYDASGAPTWTFATGNFVDGGTLPATRVIGGLCPNCPGISQEVQYTPVGSFTLGYPDPTYSTLNAAFSAGSWVRPARTFYKLSN